MHILLFILLILGLVFGPQLWARYTFSRYAKTLDSLPGTGAELASHLIDRFELESVQVEKTGAGEDHYDPVSRTVRLGPDNFDGRSLTAVAVAAHEVGHAIQHARGERMLALRHRLVQVANVLQRMGAGAMLIAPLLMALLRAPSSGLVVAAIGLLSMASAALVHLVTLPVELDASFGKALPILRAGQYVAAEQEPAVRRVLRAAAFTYVAGSLAALLNLARWVALLRRV